jgi:hypothetical protein
MATNNVTIEQAIQLMADAAEEQGADANDTTGVVRAIVTAHGLEFCAWLCVCCELADRSARREGFRDQNDRALKSPDFTAALARLREKNRGNCMPNGFWILKEEKR